MTKPNNDLKKMSLYEIACEVKYRTSDAIRACCDKVDQDYRIRQLGDAEQVLMERIREAMEKVSSPGNPSPQGDMSPKEGTP